MQSGVKAQDISEGLVESIRKAQVRAQEPQEDGEEEELADPMEVETEESYLKEFDTDGSLKDTAMKEAGGDWVRTIHPSGCIVRTSAAPSQPSR
jgi:hypothetical protein